MKHSSLIKPQFFITHPQPCAYLPDRFERKIFTKLETDNGDVLNNNLSKQGFRRSQNILYRPACKSCNSCFSARIKVSNFSYSKSQKRIKNKNKNVHRRVSNAWATEEQFELFKKYLNHRHKGGGMTEMEVYEFAAMIEETSVYSKVIEYTSGSHSELQLLAASLTDILDDGISLVYSFFDPNLPLQSLGTNIILDHVEYAKELNLPYVYLGYWVPGSKKMEYKSKFNGLEIYYDKRWQAFDIKNQYISKLSNGETIRNQVANLQLPEGFSRV
ncbi:MAG: arginyltransferase [Rhodobacteraceae bacterium]|nr:arginyltransferase [Paracoccaceae bacterium]